MSPDLKFLLDEINRLFVEQNAKWEAWFSRRDEKREESTGADHAVASTSASIVVKGTLHTSGAAVVAATTSIAAPGDTIVVYSGTEHNGCASASTITTPTSAIPTASTTSYLVLASPTPAYIAETATTDTTTSGLPTMVAAPTVAPPSTLPAATATMTSCDINFINSGSEHATVHHIVAKDVTTSTMPTICSTKCFSHNINVFKPVDSLTTIWLCVDHGIRVSIKCSAYGHCWREMFGNLVAVAGDEG